jgi:hypothetical protein
MSNIITSEGSQTIMNDLVQDLLVDQSISVCTTTQEITQDASIEHHTFYYPYFQYIAGMVIEYY